MKTVGFFGGTFDPIHFGHINLALELLEIHRLDEVLFCPAFCSPFKTKSPPIASASHRLAMLRLAIQAIPHFQLTTLETDRGECSYTIETLRALASPSIKMRLLLSEEALSHFNQWKEIEEILRLAPPLVGTRGSLPDILKGEQVTPTKIMEISSTEIRARLKKGLYCGHLVPSETLNYIYAHRLYSCT